MQTLEKCLYPMSSWARDILDPQQTLPVIWLRPNPEVQAKYWNWPQVRGYSILYEAKDGDQILGEAALGPHINMPEATCFFGIEKNSSAPKGTGLATYLLSLEQMASAESDFCNDALVSCFAKRRWEQLVREGIAIEEEPLSFSKMVKVNGVEMPFYSGRVVVPQTNVGLHTEVWGDI